MAILDRFRKKNTEETNEVTNAADLGLAQPKLPIGKDEIHKAQATLNAYKQGKANLEKRIVDNEQWYKLRHWECMRKSTQQEVEPTSAWLFNALANKHADACDNAPTCNILPREEADKQEAEILSSIIPVILDQNEFEQTYSDVWEYKLRAGTGVYGVFWNKDKLNGLGDIEITKVDIINLFWESGITDIQKSRNLFHVDLVDNDLLVGAYPQLMGRLSSPTIDVSKYIYDDTVDTSNKSVVVDWYYKKNVNGKTILHYCKYVNDEVLFATENDPLFAERGLYDHGMYPFIFDPLFKTEGTPAGFSYVDVGKNAQEYIDRGNQCIMKNMLVNAKPRYFIRKDGAVNEEEYADTNKDFIHVDGNLGQDSIIPVKGNTLSDIYVAVINNKIDELKETTGNRDVSTGGTTGGVTAASGLAALQEASAKLVRRDNRAAYRAYRKLILMVIELIRQFYDLPRQFRIVGENGHEKFVEYVNKNLQPQAQGTDFGADMGYRLPLFDLEISAEKQSPYSKMSQNELALQFYQAGFFNPQMSDQALATLDMMDFPRKQFIMNKIAENGTMYQQMLMMQQQMLSLAEIVDRTQGTNISEQIAAGVMGQQAPVATPDVKQMSEADHAESSVTRNARKRVAEASEPT